MFSSHFWVIFADNDLFYIFTSRHILKAFFSRAFLFCLGFLSTYITTAQTGCDLNLITQTFTGAGCIALAAPPPCSNPCSMYFYNPLTQTGDQAQAFAANLGANLISIQNATENACVTTALQQLGGGSQYVWIGFNDAQTEGSHVWYDQSPVSYTNWASGEPNNSTPGCCSVPLFGCQGDPQCSAGEDCVQIYSDGEWNDEYCGSANSSSIIEVNLCPVITPGPNITICPGQSGTISVLGTLFGSSPYVYTWDNGMTGTSISVGPAATTTYTVTSTDRYGCLATAQITVTVDPACMPGCDLNLITQTFVNAGCTPLTSCQSACSMYFYNPVSQTGNAAQAFAQNYGANLISVQSATENACIANALVANGFGGVIWIGFSDAVNEGSFIWYDQSVISYTNWAGGEPNQDGNEDCTQIYPNGQWNDLDCNSGGSKSVIEVNLCPVLTITPGGPTTFCSGGNVQLTSSTILGSSPYGYSWSPTTGLSASNISNPVASPTVTTTYTLTSTDRYGCFAQEDITITVLPTPTSGFTVSSPVCTGEVSTITYTGNAAANATYLWGFDGGTVVSGSGQGPYTVSWNTDGTKIITLTVTENGCMGAQTVVNIVVNPPPTAAFNATTVCANSQTDFTDASTVTGGNIVQWDWDFDDSNTSAIQNPSNTYTTGNTYNVSLTVTTDGGCTDQLTQAVTVYSEPVADFSAPDVCVGTPTDFTDLSTVTGSTITGWDWDFDDTNTDVIQNPSNPYLNANVYNVTLIVTTADNCTATITNPVTVNDVPVADFTFVDGCFGTDAVFTDASTIGVGTISNYLWDFDDTQTSTLQNPTNIYLNPGAYDVTLTVTASGNCSSNIMHTINIFEMPVADFTFTDVCNIDDAVFTDNSTVNNDVIDTWAWDFGDAATSTLQNPTHLYTSSETYPVSLTVTTANNCSNTITQDIIVFPNPVAAFNNTTVCMNEVTDFTDASTISSGNIAQWDWDFGDLVNTSTQQNPSLTYAADDTYDVTLIVTSDNNCTDVITQQVTVNPLPVVAFSSDFSEGCQPFEITFTDQTTIATGNIASWNWDLGLTTSTAQDPTYIYNQPGTYDVTLTTVSNFGCTSTLTVANAIIIHPKPVAKFSFSPQPTTILYPLIDFYNQSFGETLWHWDFGDAGTSILENPQHTYNDTGIFPVELIVFTEFNCSDTIMYDVIIDAAFTFYVPNAFTPNSDRLDEEFYGTGIGIKHYQMRIFDRWGNMIFFGDEYNPRWNGIHQRTGQEMQQDVYVYVFDLVDFNGEKFSYRGHVTLVR